MEDIKRISTAKIFVVACVLNCSSVYQLISRSALDPQYGSTNKTNQMSVMSDTKYHYPVRDKDQWTDRWQTEIEEQRWTDRQMPGYRQMDRMSTSGLTAHLYMRPKETDGWERQKMKQPDTHTHTGRWTNIWAKQTNTPNATKLLHYNHHLYLSQWRLILSYKQIAFSLWQHSVTKQTNKPIFLTQIPQLLKMSDKYYAVNVW